MAKLLNWVYVPDNYCYRLNSVSGFTGKTPAVYIINPDMAFMTRIMNNK